MNELWVVEYGETYEQLKLQVCSGQAEAQAFADRKLRELQSKGHRHVYASIKPATKVSLDR